MSVRDVFLSFVELAGVVSVGLAAGSLFSAWIGFLLVGIAFLGISWIGARR